MSPRTVIFGVPQWSDSAVCKHIARAVTDEFALNFDVPVKRFVLTAQNNFINQRD